MANTYKWSVLGMECYPNADGEVDVVFKVNYNCSTLGTVNGLPYLAMWGENLPIAYDSSQPFTPYNQLTEEQVIGWVKSTLGETGTAEVEARVDKILSDAQNPPVINPTPPWNPTQTIVQN